MRGKELTLENKLHQVSVRARVADVLADVPTGPWVVEFDPTTACNLACHDCISSRLLNTGGFGRTRVKQMLREFKEMGVRAVVLIGGGEPMAHPEFDYIVDYLHDNGIHIGITTNGTLMGKRIERLAEKVKWLRVSVDAGSDSVYGVYRPTRGGGSLFNTVMGNMCDLRHLGIEKMGYSFLVLTKDGSTNATDIIEAAHWAKEVGSDYFEVKPAFDKGHFLRAQATKLRKTVEYQLSEIQYLDSDSFKIISPYTLGEVMDGKTEQPKKYTRCLVNKLRMLVAPSGVYPCPYFRGNLNMSMGDANKETISEIWARGSEVNPSKDCRMHCIRHKTNLLLEEWAVSGMPQEGIGDYDLFI